MGIARDYFGCFRIQRLTLSSGAGRQIRAMANPTKVTKSRFEFEEAGETAWLEFERDDQGWMTLWHTEVPPSLRGRGIAATLARSALEYAREEKLKVDVICPMVAGFIRKNSEFDDLVGKRR